MMYSNVQMSSDPMMPIGMSRCGFFASCAAVLTASNPMYAKKTIAAPVKTPLQPNSPATGTPSLAVCGGMNGCQLAGLTACAANTMNSNTTATFTNTMALLKFADSLMPITSSVVTRAMMITAGRLKIAVAVVPSVQCTATPRAAERAHGTLMPTSWRNDTTYPDQPIAPMPSIVRLSAPRARFRLWSVSASACRSVTLFRRNRFMRTPFAKGDESTARDAPRFARTGDLSIEERGNDQYERRTRNDHCWSAGIRGSVNASGSPNWVSAAYGSGEMPE